MRNKKVRRLVSVAMIAALYAALTLVLAPLGFGIVQLRFSEALSLLPVLSAPAIPALTLGCALSNLIGFFMGLNPLGWIDALVGSFATLLAGYLTYRLGSVRWKGIPLLAPLPPVLVNAVILGLEFTLLEAGANLSVFFLNFASIFLSQFVVCYVIGLPLLCLLERSPVKDRLHEM